MRKKRTLTEMIQDYAIIPYGIAMLIWIFANDFIYEFFCNLFKIPSTNTFIRSSFPWIGLIFFTYLFFQNYLEKSYKIYTGRNYKKDHTTYKRSYYQLLDYFRNSDPHKLDTSTFEKQSWKEAEGIIFGTDHGRLIKINSNSECNLAIFGPPGTGKTSGIAIMSACQFAGSTLVIDIKGDIYNYVSKHRTRKIARFCPDHPNALKESIHFDPFANLSKMTKTDLKLYLESMADVLIPDSGGAGEGNYFTSRGRKMFQGIVFLLLDQNPDISFPEVIHAILQGNIFEWVKLAMSGNCIAAKELLSSFYQNSEKNITSAYDAVTSALIHYTNPVLDELLSKKGDSLSIQLLDDGIDLYLQTSQEHLDQYAPIFTLLLQQMSSSFFGRPDSSTGAKNRPILMILDEFPALSFSYEQINLNLATLRSKNVITMIICQNLSQLEYKYQLAGTRSILGNCHYHVILGSNDTESSKAYSDKFGTKKCLLLNNSISMNATTHNTGRTVQESKEQIYPPEFFGDLASTNQQVIYLNGKHCLCEKLNCYKD